MLPSMTTIEVRPDLGGSWSALDGRQRPALAEVLALAGHADKQL